MLIALASATLIAAIATAAFAPAIIAAGVIDMPDRPRKIHTRPTPTSGGVAIGLGFALSLAAAFLLQASQAARALDQDSIARIALAAGLAIAALALGVADDLRPLGPRLKSALLIALGLAAALFVAHAEDFNIVHGYTLHLGAALGVLGSAVWVFVLMNATNFMDGANGLSMGSAAISLIALAAVALMYAAPAAALPALAGAGALIGFLAWNWPAGKLFAGDSGALFAGMLSAATALLAVREGAPPFVMPIIFFPTLADTALTLLWRASRRRQLLNGHREHLYQIALRAGLKPAHVTLLYWLATLGCGAAAIGAAALAHFAAATPPAGRDWAGPVMLASLAPKLVLLALILAAARLSMQVRAFARAHGYDSE